MDEQLEGKVGIKTEFFKKIRVVTGYTYGIGIIQQRSIYRTPMLTKVFNFRYKY